MKNQHHQDCPFCKWVTERPAFLIEDNPSYLSLANISPDSEGHVLIITKEPRTDITELTQAEWKDLLPILQSAVNRIENIFHPQGFNLFSNAGKEGGARQAVFHFHLHVVPEREGNRGVGYLRKPWFIPSVEEYQKLESVFLTKQGIIRQADKAVAKLAEREKASDKGHVIITSREFINNTNQVDIETWIQMGELFRESIAKIEDNLDFSSLRTCIFLGKIGGLNLQNDSSLQIHLVPRYKAKGAVAKEVIPVPEEVLEVAEKLRQANGKPRTREIQEDLELEQQSVVQTNEQNEQIAQIQEASNSWKQIFCCWGKRN